ncbi:TfpX/TfpZ family type IV pilin accessory protein [Variovorax sp. YR752]|uniref:TfpX/TfpZ family type IV pilin accessory protein n=1 Tax=Variovorax sp. YR752 TaxID=1884383 RepID=UPI00313831E1
MNDTRVSSVKDRFVAAGWHLLISAAIALIAAALVFGLWYPDAFRLLAGGQGLFLLVVSVDVVLGPLLTFAVFNRSKGWPHLRRDLAVIGVLQLSALAYGLHAVYAARPVAIVFEVDRFRVVSAVDVYEPELAKARPEYRKLPLTGPWTLSVRNAQAGAEKTDALLMALDKGYDMGQRPIFWAPYETSRDAALKGGRPISVLLERYPARVGEINSALAARGLSVQARFLPVMARGDWVAILDPKGDIATFLAVDGFF